jgi:hypothetical protein
MYHAVLRNCNTTQFGLVVEPFIDENFLQREYRYLHFSLLI